jgi:ABC-type antimicrobial peptide transport system permease subunit
MILNYLKIAFRNLWKNWNFSLINVLGLALGITASIFIMLWIADELNMDKFHKNEARLYRFMENQHYSEDIQTFNATPGALAEQVVKDFPEIAMASQMLWNETPVLRAGNIFGNELGRYVQPDFLKMFSFDLEKGDPNTALKRPDAIVISKQLADKYFKNQNPIGKILQINNDQNLVVTGVLKKIPNNSTLRFEFLASWKVYTKNNEWATKWEGNGPRCMALVKPNTDINKLNAKLKDYIRVYYPKSNADLFLQKYSEAYLYGDFRNGVLTGGRIQNVKIFTIIAIFILLIACINFMNLATARSFKRAKEIGVRKVIGAERSNLIGQFFGESSLITIISLLFSVLLVILLLPIFNDLTEKSISIQYSNPSYYFALFAILVIIGFISGIYPALFLSSLKPIVVLKGSLKFKPSATYFRKGLVLFQFGLSLILILAIMVIHSQLNYLNKKHLGFDKENLLFLPIGNELANNFQVFKRELQKSNSIQSITCSFADPTSNGQSTGNVSWPGKDTTQSVLFALNAVDYEYTKTMGIKMAAGRDFSPTFKTDTVNFMINETAAKKMGIKNPLNSSLTLNGQTGQIVGIMKDYHINSLYNPIEPVILGLQTGGSNFGNVILRTSANKNQEAIQNLKKVFTKFCPNTPFDFRFTDQEIQANYRSELTISKLSNYFAFLAIFISCLGLFGLAAFSAEQRTKEIGIRKVLGATVSNLVVLMSKEFMVLVLLSAFIGLPIAWYFANEWLKNFAYKIDIKWYYFIFSVLVAGLIAFTTVSYQAIKAALANPVKSLKVE